YLEPRSRVRDPTADEQRHRPREDADRLAPGPGGAVALPTDEAGADGDIRMPGKDRLHEHGELGRVVLPVAVHPQREVEAMLVREAIAGLDRAADAEVEREPQHARARSSRSVGRAVP